MQIGGVLSGSTYVLHVIPLMITGNATLAGHFNFSLASGVTLSAGESLTVLTFGSHTGEFGNYTGLALANGLTLTPLYSGTSLVLTAAKTAGMLMTMMPATTNPDVDSAAFIPAISAPISDQDAQSGLSMDMHDDNTGTSPSTQVLNSVPEPGTSSLILLTAGIFLARHRRKSGSADRGQCANLDKHLVIDRKTVFRGKIGGGKEWH